ncbi:uncharacterized protein [Apostichopus japonicus]|uniref:uncharacterized protein isoform X2 n=1 Tax=Stichopus japonicus TaxID=307972 RepID=UPI003AB55587
MWRRSLKLWSRNSLNRKKFKSQGKYFHQVQSSEHISVHPRIQDAVSSGQPVVAFESTIITHGMPYPENLKTAHDVEKIALDQGVLPATVGVIKGKVCVGLTATQLEELASCEDAIKIPKREMVWAVSQQLSGGTTVSATMFAADVAGIPIFVTGGIGGVHRGGETSLDISSDLTELSRTPVCVISAGVKSILDIPKTLEYLETEGVTVATYGASKEFPAFYTRSSGVNANINVENPTSAAKLIDLSFTLGMNCGILIGVPIPTEHSEDGDLIERAIQQAMIEHEEAGIKGKDVTPFILKRVNELTDGKALVSNISLIKNNTEVGCAIAKELSLLRKAKQSHRTLINHGSSDIDIPKRTFMTQSTNSSSNQSLLHRQSKGLSKTKRCFHSNHADRVERSQPVVIGASVIDFVASLKSSNIVYGGETNTGSLRVGFGGVGRNLSDCMSRIGQNSLFISAVGKDIHAQNLRHHCQHMNLEGLVDLDYSTATYCLVIDSNGDVLLGVGDMGISNELTIDHIMKFESAISQAPLVVFDGNLSVEVIDQICHFCSKKHIPVWFEPTCVSKAKKPFVSDTWRKISYASPNLNELRVMYAALEGEETVDFDRELSLTDKLRECLQLSKRLMESFYCLIITLDEDGILVVRNSEPEEPFLLSKIDRSEGDFTGMMSAVHYQPFADDKMSENIISVSGGGDCLAAGIMAGMLREKSPDTAIKMGLLAAHLSLQSHESIPVSISKQDFSEDYVQRWASFEPSRMM